MTLPVAIASEHDAFDGQLYELLLERLLGRQVARWTGPFAFNGCRSVAKLCPAFLLAAEAAGIQHALLAVDNDGSTRRRPEHEPGHVPPAFDRDDDVTCRECWLTQALPTSWRTEPRRSCVVVPVQVIETWLLVLRGETLTPTPEHREHRDALKRQFYGKPHPPLATRVQMARQVLGRPDALEILGARPSFQRFVERIRGW